MNPQDKPVAKRYRSAREHLAGIKAAEAWHRELAAKHLLRTEQPISSEPVKGPAEGKGT